MCVHAFLQVRVCVFHAFICAFVRVLCVVTCRHIFMMLFRVSFRTRVRSRLAVGSSDRRVGSAFVRVSVWVFACVCMRFCMFVSAFVMRSYMRSIA